VEIRQLQYFTAIARTGGFRHAADALNVSPGNLSEQIKMLENELEVRLFERGPRGLRLTPAGPAFLERVDQTVLVLKTAREEMRDFAHLERGQLMVGAVPGLGAFWLTDFLVAFLNRFPNVDLRLVERSSTRLVKMVATGDVHVACVLLPALDDVLPPGLSGQTLNTSRLAAVVAPRHPLAMHPELHLEDLARATDPYVPRGNTAHHRRRCVRRLGNRA
jgi:LysR family transcriptional regulator, hydrogen peroxide-inducible genes activator